MSKTKMVLQWDYFDDGNYTAYPHPFEHDVDEDDTVMVDDDMLDEYLKAEDIVLAFQGYLGTLHSKNDIKGLEEMAAAKKIQDAAQRKIKEMLKSAPDFSKKGLH